MCAAVGFQLLVATGKALGPWRDNVLPHLGHDLPGVYLQGLLVADSRGKVLYSRSLEDDILLECIGLADQLGNYFQLSSIFYSKA